MKNVSLSLFLGFSILFCSAVPVQADIPTKVMTKIENSTVVLFGTRTLTKTNLDTGEIQTQVIENSPYCTGWVYYTKGTYAVIATAKHCVLLEVLTKKEKEEDGSTYQYTMSMVPSHIKFFDGDIGSYMDTGEVSKGTDLAIFTVHSVRHHPYATMNSNLHRGQTLYVFGTPNGQPWSLSTAMAMQGPIYNALGNNEIAPNGVYVEIECNSCYYGNSGGALFNSKGEVVGMITNISENAFFAIPAMDIMNHLSQKSKNY